MTDDRRIDMHDDPQSLQHDPRKVFPGRLSSKILALVEKEPKRDTSGIADAFVEQAKQKKRKQTRESRRETYSDS